MLISFAFSSILETAGSILVPHLGNKNEVDKLKKETERKWNGSVIRINVGAWNKTKINEFSYLKIRIKLSQECPCKGLSEVPPSVQRLVNWSDFCREIELYIFLLIYICIKKLTFHSMLLESHFQ